MLWIFHLILGSYLWMFVTRSYGIGRLPFFVHFTYVSIDWCHEIKLSYTFLNDDYNDDHDDKLFGKFKRIYGYCSLFIEVGWNNTACYI